MEFQGTIGDDWRDSEPWWPPRPDAARGRAQRGARRARRRGVRPARLLRVRHRDPASSTPWPPTGIRLDELPHDGAVLADPRLPAHRDGTTTAAAWAGWPTWPSASPATGAGRPGRTASCPRSSAPTATPPMPSGKWHLSPEDETNMASVAGHLAPRPRLRPLVRVPRRGDPPVRARASTTTTTASARPAPVEDGYHLSADLADRAIEFLGDLRAVDDRAAVLPLLRHRAPATRPTTRQPNGSSGTRVASPRGGTPGARRPSPASWPSASSPRAPCSRPARPGSRAGTTLDERERALAERFMECFAAFLSYTDQQIGRVLDFIEDLGDADNTVVIIVSDNGASSEGGREGTINEGRLSNFEGAGRRRDVPTGSTRSAARSATTTTRGDGPWRATRRSSAGSARSTRAASPIPCIVRVPPADGGPARRRGPPPVRPRHRHPARPCSSWSASTPPAEIDGIAQSHLDGTSFAYVLGDGGRARARPASSPSTSRCSGRGRSTTTAGRR